MRIVFCDDNAEIVNKLKKYVLEFFEDFVGIIPETAEYFSGDELLASERCVDIAFLDVEMPGISGIHAGARLKELNPKVKIFIVTSYADYLDEAMRFQVFRYLSKPIDKNRLFRNLKDAVSQHNEDSVEIPVNTTEGIRMVSADQIVCVELVQRKTQVCTIEGIIQSLCGMEEWKRLLPPCFYPTYRSFIVNMRYVYKVNRDLVVLKYGENVKEAYLARRRYKEFSARFLSYLESMK